ncbi:carbonate dehydratase, eukaryotic-type [Cooperia oncophora]
MNWHLQMLPWLMTACIYPCVVGPDFWGLVNRDWRMCTAGQMQSPVNIDPSQLLFDPHLERISIDDIHVEGTFENIGQLPIITINETLSKNTINITGGPALPYRYRLHQISMHFGQPDGERGSEHTVDRVRFPAEVQLLAYNIDLYTNYSQAVTQPRGLLAIAVIIDIGITTEVALRRLTVASQSITYTRHANHSSPTSSSRIVATNSSLRHVRGLVDDSWMSGNGHVDHYEQSHLHYTRRCKLYCFSTEKGSTQSNI